MGSRASKNSLLPKMGPPLKTIWKMEEYMIRRDYPIFKITSPKYVKHKSTDIKFSVTLLGRLPIISNGPKVTTQGSAWFMPIFHRKREL